MLLVDDEETIRVTLADDLKEVGHRVTAVDSGDAAVEQLTTKTFDVVVTDLRLPGADGLKVLAAAKERTPRTEVILITAYGTVETAVDAMHKGAFHFVLKPFLNDEILILVARVARMRQLELKRGKPQLTARRSR